MGILRYAGGKSRAIKILRTYIPEGTLEIVSPFMGGASLELDLAKHMQVYASDCFDPLVAFWSCMKNHRDELIDRIQAHHPFTKELYYECRAHLYEGNQMDRAVRFFIVNRCCFSGCITGGFTASRSPPSCINALRKADLTNMTIVHNDYETQLAAYPHVFAFLDPPYDVPNLYGSPEFDHERLARVLRTRNSKWILCYNDTPRIRALYEKWCEFVEVRWSYGMNASKQSNEIIIIPKHNF